MIACSWIPGSYFVIVGWSYLLYILTLICGTLTEPVSYPGSCIPDQVRPHCPLWQHEPKLSCNFDAPVHSPDASPSLRDLPVCTHNISENDFWRTMMWYRYQFVRTDADTYEGSGALVSRCTVSSIDLTPFPTSIPIDHVQATATLRTQQATIFSFPCQLYRVTFWCKFAGTPNVANPDDSKRLYLELGLHRTVEDGTQLPSVILWGNESRHYENFVPNEWRQVAVEFTVSGTFSLVFLAHHNDDCETGDPDKPIQPIGLDLVATQAELSGEYPDMCSPTSTTTADTTTDSQPSETTTDEMTSPTAGTSTADTTITEDGSTTTDITVTTSGSATPGETSTAETSGTSVETTTAETVSTTDNTSTADTTATTSETSGSTTPDTTSAAADGSSTTDSTSTPVETTTFETATATVDTSATRPDSITTTTESITATDTSDTEPESTDSSNEPAESTTTVADKEETSATGSSHKTSLATLPPENCPYNLIHDAVSGLCRCPVSHFATDDVVNPTSCTEYPAIIQILLKLDEDFPESLKDPTSDTFRALSADVSRWAELTFGEVLSAVTVGSTYDMTVQSFSAGSIIADLLFRFPQNLTRPISEIRTLIVNIPPESLGTIHFDGNQVATSISDVPKYNRCEVEGVLLCHPENRTKCVFDTAFTEKSYCECLKDTDIKATAYVCHRNPCETSSCGLNAECHVQLNDSPTRICTCEAGYSRSENAEEDADCYSDSSTPYVLIYSICGAIGAVIFLLLAVFCCLIRRRRKTARKTGVRNAAYLHDDRSGRKTPIWPDTIRSETLPWPEPDYMDAEDSPRVVGEKQDSRIETYRLSRWNNPTEVFSDYSSMYGRNMETFAPRSEPSGKDKLYLPPEMVRRSRFRLSASTMSIDSLESRLPHPDYEYG